MPANFYEKIKRIAELEHLWDREDLLARQLQEDGIYEKSRYIHLRSVGPVFRTNIQLIKDLWQIYAEKKAQKGD